VGKQKNSEAQKCYNATLDQENKAGCGEDLRGLESRSTILLIGGLPSFGVNEFQRMAGLG
jgi:hypothetical protein